MPSVLAGWPADQQSTSTPGKMKERNTFAESAEIFRTPRADFFLLPTESTDYSTTEYNEDERVEELRWRDIWPDLGRQRLGWPPEDK